MKQKSKFEDSRPVQFKQLYEKHYRQLSAQLFVCRPGGAIGCWSGVATRQRVRALARQKARHEQHTIRKRAAAV
jgi:hypothetical protein